MKEKEIAYLKAYVESEKLKYTLGLAQGHDQLRFVPGEQQKRLQELQSIMKDSETPLFNSQNIESRLNALSSQNQDLRQQLDLKNPEHINKLNIVSLAFNLEKETW